MKLILLSFALGFIGVAALLYSRMRITTKPRPVESEPNQLAREVGDMSYGLEVRNETGAVTFNSNSNIYHVVREIEVPLVKSYTIPLNPGEIVFYFKSARNVGNKPFGPYYRRNPNSLEVFYADNTFQWPSYCMLVRVIVCSV